MNETEFNRLVDEILIKIEDAVEDCSVDIDYETANGILTLEFENGTQVIINRQTPARQIWVAAKSGGYHLDMNEEGSLWHTGDKEELHDLLNRVCSEQAGVAVELAFE
ncbi:MAG: iron donor protein CyaY [Gammaproteobacteria bacterium]|nr:iron donor protein CyaY [Gammaproteobacteria bacterium]MDH5594376.1 iron donor protein CyaY [Gammaproteobacteria bacterium]MDH5614470.1 iron donor protein CyaY [Gammaproteobacteria bacterium]